MIESFLGWLGGTAWSVALLESLWVWPLVESTHVLGITLFVGTVAMNSVSAQMSLDSTTPLGGASGS